MQETNTRPGTAEAGREKLALSGVPETMLQTLYARARESQTRGAIRDPRAEELIRRLDYDFSLAEKDRAMRSGVIARTLVLDRLTTQYLFTGDTIWLGADGGYSFISALAEDNRLAVRSLSALEERLRRRGLQPLFITGHTGWTDNFAFAFARKDRLCSPFGKRVHDPNAPYDAYDESDDTAAGARAGLLPGVGR